MAHQHNYSQQSDTAFNQAVQLCRQATKVVVFSGAGMSAESGLSVYRNDDTGLWENVNAADMASIDSWCSDPAPMWAWYLWRAQQALEVEPNAGHKALARWAKATSTQVNIVTQNIDDLHERAGSDEVIHLHGSLFKFHCTICWRPYKIREFITAPIERLDPPLCPLCHNPIRPGVVWFGEPLPTRQWEAAESALSQAEVVLIIGTSGIVQPAASLPLIAQQCGARLIEITPKPTELTPLVDLSLTGTAATTAVQLVDALINSSTAPETIK